MTETQKKEIDTVKDLRSMTIGELKSELKEAGFPAFRADQLYRWLHVQIVRSYDEMTNLPRNLIQYLEEHYILSGARMADRQISALDGTQKFLFAMRDNCLVESVLMKYHYGNTICISSQVGCRMGCSFCASTLDGLERNLLPGEMLEQIYEIRRQTGEKISHIVVMGTGEPLDNYDNLVRFLHLVSDENGMNLSQRSITVSTCGLAERIMDLAGEQLSITLAISLHAVTDEKRRQIMPVANRYSIEELMRACTGYFDKTGRRITFEYSLIHGVNDLKEDAVGLTALAKRVHAHVNLIPVNPVAERGYERPTDAHVQAFKMELEKSGINVSIRRALGRDIDGACGQLRHRQLSCC
ncbi:MAG: 23S rRNA (adenine(2503)-C(2))-methyltransferase RlmN [Lachnospiraceae bacterium]|nr:23S rRNA (adenine(2503)-C(2))-methyltransferase RlmN [Lachnospiraceae bacterium]